jgi:transcription elongation factor SPT6
MHLSTSVYLFYEVIVQIPKDKLLTAFEEVLVDITNEVGVDINRAVADPYYQHLLPFICGLGPRKAQVLVKKITSQVCGCFFNW